jgi:hypothetical protein
MGGEHTVLRLKLLLKATTAGSLMSIICSRLRSFTGPVYVGTEIGAANSRGATACASSSCSGGNFHLRGWPGEIIYFAALASASEAILIARRIAALRRRSPI